MDAELVKAKIKEIIGNVAELDPNTIQDDDNLRQDLNLDSLARLRSWSIWTWLSSSSCLTNATSTSGPSQLQLSW